MPAHRPLATPAPVFEIWQAGAAIVSIDNPVRLQLLRELEEAPRTLSQFMASTAKAKSTLSALHLPPLLKAGLVSEANDPKDARVKWYTLQGSRLGSSSVNAPLLRDAVIGYAQRQGLVPLGPMLEVLDAASLGQSDIRAYADGVADRLGRLMGRMLSAQEHSERAKELGALLEREKIGRIAWSQAKFTVEAAKPWDHGFVQRLAEAALAKV